MALRIQSIIQDQGQRSDPSAKLRESLGVERARQEDASVGRTTDPRRVHGAGDARELRFPEERGVEKLRGEVEGRRVAGVVPRQSLDKLPSQVQPFSTAEAAAEGPRMTSGFRAERAARSLESPDLEAAFQPIVGDDEADVSGTAALAPKVAEAPVPGTARLFEQRPAPVETESKEAAGTAALSPQVEEDPAAGTARLFEARGGAGEEASSARGEQPASAEQGQLISGDQVREEEGEAAQVVTVNTNEEGVGPQASAVTVSEEEGEGAGNERAGSEEATLIGRSADAEAGTEAGASAEEAGEGEEGAPVAPEAQSSSGEALSEEELRELESLRQRDREVRAHEQAHASVGGPHTRGGPHYNYETGPDGRQYATSGHVDVDLSEGKTPEATADKMRTIRRAALAPASPSAADRQVAAEASRMEREATQEARALKREEAEAAQEGAEALEAQEEAVRVAGGERPPLPGTSEDSARAIQAEGLEKSAETSAENAGVSRLAAAAAADAAGESERPSRTIAERVRAGGSRRLAAYEPGYPGS